MTAFREQPLPATQEPISWYAWIERLPDPRVLGRCSHDLIDILVITFCALLCGAESLVEIAGYGKSRANWLKERLGLSLPEGIPSHDTFGRVLSLINPKALEWIFFQWMKGIREARNFKPSKHIAFDGKSIQGTDRTFNQGNRPVHLVSAYCSDSGLVLGQRPAKSSGFSERQAILDCLELLDVKGTLVTFDAASSCPHVFLRIRQKQGHYLAPIKKNLKRLWSQLDSFFEHQSEASLKKKTKDFAETLEQNRGRMERRSCTVVAVSSLPKEAKAVLEDYADAKSVIRIKRYREQADKRYFLHLTGEDGKTSYVKNTGKKKIQEETVYYLSSRSCSAYQFLLKIRDHWKIESQLHWSLDVSFAEDDWRVQEKKAARNLATLRKMAFNVLKQEPSKQGLKGKIKRAAWEPEFLEQVLLNLEPQSF